MIPNNPPAPPPKIKPIVLDKNKFSQLKSILTLIKNSAKDCVGGKHITILRKDWMKFEKIYDDLNGK